mgnify:CR=1 FL=1
MELVQLYQREPANYEAFDRLNRSNMQSGLDSIFYSTTFNALVEFMTYVTMVIVLWYGGNAILGGAMSFGLLVAFFQFTSMMFEPIEDVSEKYTILQSLQAVARGQTDTELRTLLGAFLFTGDDVFKPVGVLSGGEKSRVALARTLLHPANFLILDEPTNHLDIQSVGVLIEALRQYAGTFVIVSHDRHFLDQVANRVWHVGHGGVQTFPGTYTEYRWSLEHGTTTLREDGAAPASRDAAQKAAASKAEAAEAERASGPKTKEQKRREAEERARLRQAVNGDGAVDLAALNPYQLRKVYEKIEGRISTYMLTITAINAGFGCSVAIAMYLLGLPNPVLWGVLAALLNFVPYLGGLIGAALICFVSLYVFDDSLQMMLPPLCYLLLNGAEAYFVTPMILGQTLSLSPVAVLLSLMFWGWLWGVVGVVLAVPLLIVVKVACANTRVAQGLAVLLRE